MYVLTHPCFVIWSCWVGVLNVERNVILFGLDVIILEIFQVFNVPEGKQWSDSDISEPVTRLNHLT